MISPSYGIIPFTLVLQVCVSVSSFICCLPRRPRGLLMGLGIWRCLCSRAKELRACSCTHLCVRVHPKIACCVSVAICRQFAGATEGCLKVILKCQKPGVSGSPVASYDSVIFVWHCPGPRMISLSFLCPWFCRK